MPKLPPLGGVGRAVIAVLAIGAGLATYYTLSSSAKERGLERRNLRVLGLMSRQVSSSINGLEGIFRNTTQPLGAEWAAFAAAETPNAGGRRRLAADIEAAGRLVAHLDVEARLLTGPPPANVPECGGAADHRRGLDETRLEMLQRCVISAFGILVTGRTDLDAFLVPMLRSDAFDEVLVIDGAGHILLQNGSGLVMARQLDLPPAVLVDAEGVAVDEELLDDFSRTAEISAGGSTFRLFLQPVVGLTHPTAGQLAVVGLTESSRFRSEASTIDPNSLLLLILLLILVVLTMPFIKFTAMATTDPVGVRDVLFFFFSLVMAAGVLTLSLIDVHWYASLCERVDEQGAALAEQIEHNLYHELDEILTELEVQNGRFRPPADSEPPQIRTRLDRDGFPSYPYLEMVTWANAAGLQRAKWTTRDAATPVVSLAGREAFKRVHDGRLWSLPTDPEGSPRPFALQSIRSRNTGSELAMIAVPYPNVEHPGWSSFVITRSLSVIDTRLPPGHGFMILEPDGDVLFHSKPERNLRENLFESTESHALLRAAVIGRVERSLSLRYRGRGVRMSVRPIELGDLTIATFIDKSLLRTINFETVAFTAFLFAIYLGLVLLLFVVYAIFAPRAGVRWIWPDRDRPSKYTATIGVQLATLLLFMILHPFAPRVLLPVTFALPFVALGFCILIVIQSIRGTARLKLLAIAMIGVASFFNLLSILHLRGLGSLLLFALHLATCWALLWRSGRPSASLFRWSAKHMRSLYLASGLVTLIVTGMMTAATFFRVVHFDHARLLVRHGQLEMARAMDARYTELRSSYGSSKALLADRLCHTHDVYFSTFFGTRHLGTYPEIEPDHPCGTLDREQLREDQGTVARLRDEGRYEDGFDRSAEVHRLLAEYLPFYDEISVETRLLYEHRAADRKWAWWRVPRTERAEDGEAHPFYFDYQARDGSPGRATLHLISNSPALEASGSPLWWLAVAASILGILAALRFVVRRVFLLNVEVSGPVALERLFRDGVSSHMMLLCPPLTEHARLFPTQDPDTAIRVDVREHLEREPFPEVPAPTGETTSPVFVMHPEAALSSPETNLKLLGWLERTLDRSNRAVVLACSRRAEAAHFLPETPGGADDPAAEDGDAKPTPSDHPLFQRWNQVLSRFTRIHARVESDSGVFGGQLLAHLFRQVEQLRNDPEGEAHSERLHELNDLVSRECWGNPRLEEIGLRIFQLPGLERRTRSEVLDSIRDAADGYYRALWVTLSPAEKLVAAQLAHGYLVNYKAIGAFRQLAQKQIVKRQPYPRLMNSSFARFVREESPPERIVAWRGDPGPSIWQRLRTPIYLGVVGTALFLFLTQRALFQSTLAFASAMTAALPLLFRLLDRVQVKSEQRQGG